MRSKDYDKIDVIFSAALQLIHADGIAGLTMAKIARAAGLATGTLYIYFTNKEDLINALYRKLEKESLERFLSGYSEDMPFRESLKRVWTNYLKHRIDHHEESVFLEQYYRSPYITSQHKRIAEQMKSPVHQLISRGKEEGVVRSDADEEILFLAMLGFIRELADEHVDGIYILNQSKIDKAFQLSWDMLTG
ncbi:MAG: TetR/AcrR family transcriptional regulator [Bacteroidota bacterium]